MDISIQPSGASPRGPVLPMEDGLSVPVQLHVNGVERDLSLKIELAKRTIVSELTQRGSAR
ncbi:MAG: hypothetical protein ABJA98_03795 [Acidobacteriota bacterium]